jgi:hypothetical protein
MAEANHRLPQILDQAQARITSRSRAGAAPRAESGQAATTAPRPQGPRTISATGICHQQRDTLRWRKEGLRNSGKTNPRNEVGQTENLPPARLALSPGPVVAPHPIMATASLPLLLFIC